MYTLFSKDNMEFLGNVKPLFLALTQFTQQFISLFSMTALLGAC